MIHVRENQPGCWLTVWALVVLAGGCGQPGDARRPDILLITIDTLRADRVGCYGYQPAATPTLDRLAAAGTRYAYCVAPAPVTLPSHASIMTGQLPARLGVRNNGTYRLGAGPTTLAEALARKGYATGAFVAAFPVAARFGLDRGFDHYDDELQGHGEGMFSYAERPAAEVTGSALDWVASRERGKPLFLWVHFFEPHAPYTPPAPFDRSFADQPYDGEVAAADAAVAELLVGCRRLRPDLWLTVLTSDHGEGLGEHGEDSHAFFLYETTLRVPLIMHAPGLIPTGEVVNEPVGLIDLAPTILNLAGITDHRVVSDGIALVPGQQPPRRDLISETLAGLECCGWSPAFSLRHGLQKVILSAQSRAYDLASDPGEQHDLLLSGSSTWVDALHRRATRFVAALDTMQGSAAAGGDVTRQLTAAEKQQLTALGYVVGGGAGGQTAAPGSDLLRRMTELPDAGERLQAHGDVGQAQKLIGSGEYQAAIALLEPVLTENPLNSNARSLLAGSYRELGRHDEALAEFSWLVEQLPRRLEPRINLARELIATGDPQAAVEHYSQAIALAPEDFSLLQEAVIHCVRYRRYGVALTALRAATALPDLSPADRSLLDEAQARIHLARGEPERGEAYLARTRGCGPARAGDTGRAVRGFPWRLAAGLAVTRGR